MPRCSLDLSSKKLRPEGPETSSSPAGLMDLRVGLDRLAERLDELSDGFLELRATLQANARPAVVNSRGARRAPGSVVFPASQPALAPVGPSRG